MGSDEGLSRYHGKRDFARTQEPEGKVKKTKGFRYLIQKHAATRLHYDFRLELDGMLKSWAVTRGPSLDPADKRLAVEVEDHPVDYGAFEGTIPMGQYGGGTVMLWDRGTWEPVGDPHDGLEAGKLVFKLHGERLTGEWTLVRMHGRPSDRGRQNWLLIKHHDAIAHEGDHDALLTDNATSIASGRSMEEIAEGSQEWKAGKSRRKTAASADEKTLKKARAADAHSLTFIEPELATLVDIMPAGDNWVHEVKFDGYRIQALVEGQNARMMTRTGLDWTPKFKTIDQDLARLGVKSAILDGEMVALDDKGASSFKTLQDELSQGRSDRLQYYVFDLLALDGEDLRAQPLLERKRRLKALLEKGEAGARVLYSEHFAYESDVLEHVCGLAYEGVICKRADSRYSSGRNRNWLKVKCHKRQEFVIGGFTEPKGGRRGIGALLLGYYAEEQLVYAGKVGTGFDNASSLEIRKVLDGRTSKATPFNEVPADGRRGAFWVTPDLVCEVEFTEWTPDGRLRHPSYQGLREDKSPNDVAREQPVHVTKTMRDAKPEREDKPPVENPDAQVKAPKVKVGKVKAGKVKAANAEVDGVRISHPDRVIYPDTDITKGDLAEYYDAVRDHILPFVTERPLSMVRCPEGIGGQCFFQRHIAREQSPYLFDTGIPVKGRNEDYLMIKDARGLITLVQWGAIEIHPWGCKADRPELPDKIIFDLDPDPGVAWADVIDAVKEVRSRMDEFGLKSFLKTTGGKGLHITVPLTPKHAWPAIKAFARAVAQSMEHDAPDRFIATMSKEKRKGRIFVDYLRNELTATAVAPYAVRARPGATVATPLDWSELTTDLKPAQFTIATVPQRLKSNNDPWSDYFAVDQTVNEAILEALRIDH
jgi:bifunctional non-homologous end joining protein LigD